MKDQSERSLAGGVSACYVMLHLLLLNMGKLACENYLLLIDRLFIQLAWNFLSINCSFDISIIPGITVPPTC